MLRTVATFEGNHRLCAGASARGMRRVLSLCLHVLTEASRRSCPASMARASLEMRRRPCRGREVPWTGISDAERSGVDTVTPPYVPASSLGT